MKNCIILHGSFGEKDGNWFAWLRGEIEKRGFSCRHEQFPVGVGVQTYENWAKTLDKFKIDKDTVIFAHSAAPVFAVKYLMSNKKKIAKLVSVAGFNAKLGYPEFDEVNSTFLMKEINNFEKYCGERICIFGDDDPYVKFANADKFADEIKAKKVIIKGGKHLNAEFGYTKLEELLKFL